MTIEVIGTTVEVLGKVYQLKCPDKEVAAVQHAAKFLADKMQEIRAANQILSIDRVAVITALNMTHQFLTLENEKTIVEQRLRELESKLERFMLAGQECSSAE